MPGLKDFIPFIFKNASQRSLEQIEENDDFADFDPAQQVRSIVHTDGTVSLRGYELVEAITEQMVLSANLEERLIQARKLSPAQKGLYFWQLLDEVVKEGGFSDFYRNGSEVYMPSLIKGLKLIGDMDMVFLLQQVQLSYLQLKEDHKGQQHFPLDKLEKYLLPYLELNVATLYHWEKFILADPGHFFVFSGERSIAC